LSFAKRRLEKIETGAKRDKKFARLKEELGITPEASRIGYLGVTIVNSTSPQGVLIKGIAEVSATAKSELRVGDVVINVSGKSISNIDDFNKEKLNNNSSPGDEIRIVVNRQGKTHKIDIKLMSLADYIIAEFDKAEAGDGHAMLGMAMLYKFGQGLDKNTDKLRAWLLKAAENDSVQAMNELGFIFQYGKGVKKNHKKALSWHQKAANRGVVDSMYNVGFMLENGQGKDKKDMTSALKHYRKASNNGHTKAMLKVAYAIQAGVLGNDSKKLVKLYKAVMEKNGDGRLEAASQLGTVYLKGKGGLAKNYKKAAFYARKALSFSEEISLEREDAWPLYKKMATDTLLTVITQHDGCD